MKRWVTAFAVLATVAVALWLGVDTDRTVEQPAPRKEQPFHGRVVKLEAQQIKPGAGALVVDVRFPPHYELNKLAPSRVEIALTGDALRFADGAAEKTVSDPHVPLHLPLTFTAGDGTITATLTLLYCEHGIEARCLYEHARMIVPVKVEAGAAASDVIMTHKVDVGK